MDFFEKLKSKLSSRKLWSAVIGVAVALSAMFGLDEMTTGQITGLISAVGVLVAYIFAEAQVDSARSTQDTSKKEENGTKAAELNSNTTESEPQSNQISLFSQTNTEFLDNE